MNNDEGTWKARKSLNLTKSRIDRFIAKHCEKILIIVYCIGVISFILLVGINLYT